MSAKGGGQRVKRFERSNGVDTALKTYLLPFNDECGIRGLVCECVGLYTHWL